VLTLALGLSSPAAAQSDWANCSSGDTGRIIQGCSAILSAGTKVPSNQRAVAYVNRGIAYYDRGELTKARSDYTAAIRLDPKRGEAFHNRADLELRIGEIEAAIPTTHRSSRSILKLPAPTTGAAMRYGKMARSIAPLPITMKR
jgi:tetratricopeptide (TPR) repeat protein